MKEFKDLSKSDGRGQYKKGAKHRGQFVYIDSTGKPKVRPVYVFESVTIVKKELEQKGLKTIGFFFADCLVEIQNSFDYNGRWIPAGIYRMATMTSAGQTKINNSLEIFKNPIGIADLLKAGFRRLK